MDKFLVVVDHPPPVASSLTLIDKYKPTRAYQVITHDITFACIKKWIQQYKAKDPSIKKCLVLSGVPGIGKNLLARLLLEEEGYKPHIISCHEIKSKTDFTEYLHDLSNFTTTKPKALVITNLDGLNTMDNGVIGELVQFINPLKGIRTKMSERDAFTQKYWKIPIICICNKTKSGKILDVIKVSDCVDFKRPPKAQVITYFKNIVHKEGIKCDVEAIVDGCQGDIRQTFLNLWNGRNPERKDATFDVAECMAILFSPGLQLDVRKCLRLFQVDTSVIPMLVFENYPDTTRDIDVVADIAESMSCGDVFENAIFSKQLWDMTDFLGSASCVYPIKRLGAHRSSAPLKTSKVWSKISNMCTKQNQFKELTCRLKSKQLEYVYHLRDFLYGVFITDGVDAFIRQAVEYSLDEERLYLLMKISSLSPIKSEYKLTTHTKVRKRWKELCET